MATKKSNSNFDLIAFLDGNKPSNESNLSQHNDEEINSKPTEPSQPSEPTEKIAET